MNDFLNVPMASFYLMLLSVTMALVIGIGSRAWRHHSTRVLWLFVVGAFVFTIAEQMLWQIETDSMSWFHNFFSFYEVFLITWLFYVILHKYRIVVLVFGLLALLSQALEMWIIGHLDSVTPVSSLVLILIIILGSVIGFYLLFVEEEEDNVFQSPVFWILTGSLLHATAAIFSIGLSKFIFTNEATNIQGMWSFYNIFNAIRYLCYAMSFYVVSKRINPRLRHSIR